MPSTSTTAQVAPWPPRTNGLSARKLFALKARAVARVNPAPPQQHQWSTQHCILLKLQILPHTHSKYPVPIKRGCSYDGLTLSGYNETVQEVDRALPSTATNAQAGVSPPRTRQDAESTG